MHRPALLLSCFIPLLPLPAQNPAHNVEVLARLSPTGTPGGAQFSDIWGYVSPTGRELALLCGVRGLWVIECTDPANPVQRAFFPNAVSGWQDHSARDVRTYDHYAYVVSEGGGGMQIIDLSDPGQPTLVTTWGAAIWSNAHNLAIDPVQGRAYPCGTDIGMPILDLGNPTQPQQVGLYTTNTVHDLQVQGGIAHAGESGAATYRLLDVTALPGLAPVGSAPVPAAHNAWPSRDNLFAVTTSELAGGHLRVFDISAPRLPRQIAAYRTGPSSSIIHNAYLRDRVCHIAYYAEGYRAVDLSDPTRPVELGNVVTSPGTGAWSGAWGCYPFQPSGVVYVSDTNGGLFVLRSKALGARYGRGSVGAGAGGVPSIHTHGAAFLGNANFRLEVEDARPASAALLLLGTARAELSVAGLTIHVDVLSAQNPYLLAGAATDNTGKASLSAPIPNVVAFRGVKLNAQYFVVDPTTVVGLASTRGLEFELFQR